LIPLLFFLQIDLLVELDNYYILLRTLHDLKAKTGSAFTIYLIDS